MKKVFRKTSLLLATALMGVTGMQAQKAPQDMDRFIDALMKKMTVEEKIGQLNLPVSGEIVTGQAQNSDVAKKIEQGWVGGLLNLKGVEKIRDVQKLAIEKSRLGLGGSGVFPFRHPLLIQRMIFQKLLRTQDKIINQISSLLRSQFCTAFGNCYILRTRHRFHQ